MECPLFDFPNELQTFQTFPISHSENVECFQKLKTQSFENIPERESSNEDKTYNLLQCINDRIELSNNNIINLEEQQNIIGDNRKIEIKMGFHKELKTTCFYYDLIHNYNFHLVIIIPDEFLINNLAYLQVYVPQDLSSSLEIKSSCLKFTYPCTIKEIPIIEDEEDNLMQKYQISNDELFNINTILFEFKNNLLLTLPRKYDDLTRICKYGINGSEDSKHIYKPGAIFKIHNLSSKPEYNDKQGMIKSYDSIKNRYNVDLLIDNKNKVISVGASKLVLLDSLVVQETMKLKNMKNLKLSDSQNSVLLSMLLKESNIKKILRQKNINETIFTDKEENLITKIEEVRGVCKDEFTSLLLKNTVISDLNSGKSCISAALLSCPIIAPMNKSITSNFSNDNSTMNIVNCSIIVSSYSNMKKWEKLLNIVYDLPCFFINNKFDLRKLLNNCHDDCLGNDLSIDPNAKIPFDKNFKKKKDIKFGDIRLNLLNIIPVFVVCENIYRNFYNFVDHLIFQRVIYDHPEKLEKLGFTNSLFRSYHNIYITNLPYLYFNLNESKNYNKINFTFNIIDDIFQTLSKGIQCYLADLKNSLINYYNYNESISIRYGENASASNVKIFTKILAKYQELLSIFMIKCNPFQLSSERKSNKFLMIKMFCKKYYEHLNNTFTIIPEKVLQNIRDDKLEEAICNNDFPTRTINKFIEYFEKKEEDKDSFVSEIKERMMDSTKCECSICLDEIDCTVVPHCCYQKFCFKCMILSMVGGMNSHNDVNATCPLCRHKFNSKSELTLIKDEKYDNIISSNILVKDLSMAIQEIINTSKNNSKFQMLYRINQYIIKNCDTPKIIIVSNSYRYWLSPNNKELSNLFELFKENNIRWEDITRLKLNPKIIQILKEFESFEFCLNCIILSDYKHLLGMELKFVSDIIFMDDDITNNLYYKFINTLKDFYTEKKQRVWILRDLEELNYNY